MSTKKREVIWGGRIMGAEICAQSARKAAQKAAREADASTAALAGPRWSAIAPSPGEPAARRHIRSENGPNDGGLDYLRSAVFPGSRAR